LISASIVVETIFSWPGVGKLVVDSIDTLDRPVIIAYMMIAVLSFVIVNFVVDAIYAWLDPRVRSGASANG
jgi:peptide/nickel transport system permease protein